MKELIGDIWSFEGWKAIPTNGCVKVNNENVMGRGLALQAKQKFPSLPLELGTLISNHGNHVHLLRSHHLISFPVKHIWYQKADLKLIKKSAEELQSFPSNALIDDWATDRVYLPRVGCGNGRLDWADVRKILADCLDDRFCIVSLC